ncbi:MAG: helix-turn-helix domain-containing protein [Bacillota bacterium]
MEHIDEQFDIFSKRLTELREEKAVQQKTAAAQLDIKPQVLAYYEKGKRKPDFETLKKLANYYNVTVDYLIGNSDFRTPTHEKISTTTGIEASDAINHIQGVITGVLETYMNYANIVKVPDKYKDYQEKCFNFDNNGNTFFLITALFRWLKKYIDFVVNSYNLSFNDVEQLKVIYRDKDDIIKKLQFMLYGFFSTVEVRNKFAYNLSNYNLSEDEKELLSALFLAEPKIAEDYLQDKHRKEV